MSEIYMIIAAVTGLVLGSLLSLGTYSAYMRKKKSTAKEVLDNAHLEVEKTKKEKLIQFREEMQKKRSKFYEEFKSKENQIQKCHVCGCGGTNKIHV